MTKEETNTLIKLLHKWKPNCNGNCRKCYWGVRWAGARRHICPLYLTQDMISMQEREPSFWRQMKG